MRVQLRRDIAEQADVELLDRKAGREPDRPHAGADKDELLHQTSAVPGREILNLARLLDARHEHDPGPARIVLQPNSAKPKVDDIVRRAGKGGVEREHGPSLAGWATAV